MCGRVRPKLTPQIAAEFGIVISKWDHTLSDYDARPTDIFPVIRVRGGVREAVTMRWGMIPHWAHGVPLKASTFNATVERMAEAPVYRSAWQRGQRCIIPVTCFFEPHINDRRARTTYRVWVKDRAWFGLAGLWDQSITAEGEVIESCTIITMPASPRLAEIHNEKRRQPVMLREEDHEAWLTGTPEQARAAIRHYPDELIEAEFAIAGRFSGIEQPQGDLF